MSGPTRRDLLALTAAAAACACAGCPLLAAAAAAKAPPGAPMDVGPVEDFAKDGITDRWSDQGFFIVRRRGRLYAVSSTCTHRKVRLVAGKDADGFKCPRHGSLFDPEGHVTKSPARKPLPRFGVRVDERNHLIVDRSTRFEEREWQDKRASADLDARG